MSFSHGVLFFLFIGSEDYKVYVCRQNS